MTAVAEAEGFTPTQLFSAQATTTRIKQEIARAAQQLNSGGFFFLTYAGHGGQAPDMTGTEEADHQDETWVCYDRQWLDDELQEALSAFRAGVNIVVLSDSCHSGTMYRIDPPAWMDTRAIYEAGGARQLNEQRDALQSRFYDLKRAFYCNMALPRPGPAEPPFAGFPRPADGAPEDGQATLEVPVMAGSAARSQATTYDPGQAVRNYEPLPLRAGSGGSRGVPGGDTQAIVTREIPYAENVMINREQRAALGESKERTRSRAPVVASGILGAGCEDNQLSQEVGGNGVFTTTLNRIWANNGFSGSYIDLINQIKAQMGPSQTPVLTPFGANTQQWATMTPFNVS
jgi:hypothetical protein